MAERVTARVQPGPFDVGAELAAMTAGRADIGGIGCFVGLVRGGDVAALTLEHHPGMTERHLARIAAQAAARWSLLGVTLVHRHGRLLPGEQIVLVLTATRHRADALDSAAFLIDWLKTNAPFWKREELADGTTRWVAARAEDEAAAARWSAPDARIGGAG